MQTWGAFCVAWPVVYISKMPNMLRIAHKMLALNCRSMGLVFLSVRFQAYCGQPYCVHATLLLPTPIALFGTFACFGISH